MPNKKVNIFWPFRKQRLAAPAPSTVESDPAAYDRAWADYVEWSGLDEAGLPDTSRPDEQ